MKLIALILVLCVLQNEVVQSGVILGTLNKIGSTVKCKVHKVGNIIYKHDHKNEPCGTKEDTGKFVTFLDKDVVFTENEVDTTNNYLIDIRAGDVTTEFVYPTVSDGRRLFAAGSNCPEGYRADSRGRCRQKY